MATKLDTDYAAYGVTVADVDRMLHHGSPVVRKAGRTLREMQDRHLRGEYNRAKDVQSVDDALGCLPAWYEPQPKFKLR